MEERRKKISCKNGIVGGICRFFFVQISILVKVPTWVFAGLRVDCCSDRSGSSK